MSKQKPIPNKLLGYRLHTGLRQKDVAKLLGMSSDDRISKWERGLTYPHIINLFKLCALYNVLPHELYGELLEDTRINK